jgi:NAD(P)-dependent dehydrogenase (short-subunit alcohol dehydrogenase family)
MKGNNTMKTVPITGCSSGYGLAIARHFHAQGWNVIATMRTPREDVLPQSDRLRVLKLDVTKSESIAAVLEACGPIDVLVNNAGIGVVGAFEVTPMNTVREVFETNTFGVMAMTQAVLPQFRAEVGRGGERDLKHDAGADAVGGCVHREQGSH